MKHLKRWALAGSLLLMPWVSAWAGAPMYPVDNIPQALLTDAASVVRAYDVVITLERPDRYSYQVKRAVTVLRAAGSDEARLMVATSSLHKLRSLTARVFDASGKQLRKLSGSADWQDVSATDASTYLGDIRAQVADARQGAYPYTVELVYEIASVNPLFLPDWQPQHHWHQSVERATLRLQHPASLPVRWQASHLPAQAARPDTVASNGALLEHRWCLTAAPALASVPLAPPLEEQAPAVWCAPTEFSVQDHAGNQSTWAALGRWWYELNADRDELPLALRAEMVALQDSVPDPRKRAQYVYQRVQRTTRYVSIQLGLGGWQTMPAAEVARTGYGDCKALATYTRALLGAAGLPAHWALVTAGDDAPDLHPEWVAPQFNHVILCVPLPAVRPAPADTVWLECTSTTRPFNSLGDFTTNRHVLLVTPTGGRLARTPVLDATTSQRLRRTDLRLDAKGQATATVRTIRTGVLGDAYTPLLALDPTQQRREISEALSLNTPFVVNRARLTALPATPAGANVREEIELTLPSGAARAGTRLRLPLNHLSQWAIQNEDLARTAPLWLPPGTAYADTVVIHLPANAKAEALPPAVAIDGRFGKYTATVVASADGNTLTYTRHFRTIGGQFPKDQYNAYALFCQQIARADRQLATISLGAAAP
jgi:Domain of Unknown Function with PDB structure (DUF3857)/Transglutaminase-like superfamily